MKSIAHAVTALASASALRTVLDVLLNTPGSVGGPSHSSTSSPLCSTRPYRACSSLFLTARPLRLTSTPPCTIDRYPSNLGDAYTGNGTQAQSKSSVAGSIGTVADSSGFQSMVMALPPAVSHQSYQAREP